LASDKEKENIKDVFLIHKGFDIIHIFDDEYKNDPQETLNRCIQFLTE